MGVYGEHAMVSQPLQNDANGRILVQDELLKNLMYAHHRSEEDYAQKLFERATGRKPGSVLRWRESRPASFKVWVRAWESVLELYTVGM